MFNSINSLERTPVVETVFVFFGKILIKILNISFLKVNYSFLIFFFSLVKTFFLIRRATGTEFLIEYFLSSFIIFL